MTILKTEKVKPDYRMIGANLPIDMHNYLTLFTLAKGFQKTDVIKELFLKWMNLQKETEKDLIKIIITQASEEWHSDEHSKKRRWKTFDLFIVELRDELDAKGLLPAYTEEIIKGIKK